MAGRAGAVNSNEANVIACFAVAVRRSPFVVHRSSFIVCCRCLSAFFRRWLLARFHAVPRSSAWHCCCCCGSRRCCCGWSVLLGWACKHAFEPCLQLTSLPLLLSVLVDDCVQCSFAGSVVLTEIEWCRLSWRRGETRSLVDEAAAVFVAENLAASWSLPTVHDPTVGRAHAGRESIGLQCLKDKNFITF